jgi:hypothetical protein
MRYVAAVFLLFSLFGCKEPQKPASNQYQMSIAPSGQIYQLNQVTGEIKAIEVNQSASSKPMKLTVGSMYETEKGTVLRYVGNNKFENRPSLDQIFK